MVLLGVGPRIEVDVRAALRRLLGSPQGSQGAADGTAVLRRLLWHPRARRTELHPRHRYSHRRKSMGIPVGGRRLWRNGYAGHGWETGLLRRVWRDVYGTGREDGRAGL